MGTTLVTGGASGMGLATAELRRRKGDTVITVDLHGADIEADLGTPEGRRHMLSEVRRLAPGGIDALLAAAGISDRDRPDDVVSVNYFGTVATLEGLLPLFMPQSGGRAVAVGSTASMLPGNEAIVAACLGDNEKAARAAAAATPDVAYFASKRALSLWLRRTAITKRWAGRGVLLNGVSPGVVDTLMTEAILRSQGGLEMIRQINPIAVAEYANATDIAELLSFLLEFRNPYLVGQIIYIDGGTDAIMRPHLF